MMRSFDDAGIFSMRPLTVAAASALFAALALPGIAGPRLPRPAHFISAAPRPHLPRQARAGSNPRAPAVNEADPAAQDLLKRMLQAENSLALSGDQITTIAQNGLDISSEQLVQRNGARAMRLDYLRPPRLAGEQIIDNGRFYCHLIPAKDTLELSPSRIQTLRVRVPEIIEQVRSGRLIVQGFGTDVIAGHLCGIVSVAARSASPVPWRRFWIDPTNGAQLRIEQYDAAGQLQSASHFTQVTYNPVFDKAAFRVPHAGSKVIARGFGTPSLTLDQVRQQAGATWPVPTYLPEGFHYQAGSVSNLRDRRVVELCYVNGVNALSVFQTPDSEGKTPEKTVHARHGVLLGHQGGMKVVIIGNLPDGELEKVLASLR